MYSVQELAYDRVIQWLLSCSVTLQERGVARGRAKGAAAPGGIARKLSLIHICSPRFLETSVVAEMTNVDDDPSSMIERLLNTSEGRREEEETPFNIL